jgi:hypothetical protein
VNLSEDSSNYNFTDHCGTDAVFYFDGNGTDLCEDNTITVTGATQTTSVEEIRGKIYEFDGDDSINLGVTPAMELQEQSVSLWFSYPAFSSDDRVLFDVQARMSLELDDDLIRLEYYNGSTFKEVIAANNLLEDMWYHSVLVYNLTEAKIYLDGELVKTGNKDIISFQSDRNSLIGDNHFLNNSFNGSIDDVAVFNRSLSAAEISKMYEESKHDRFQASFPTLPITNFDVIGSDFKLHSILGGATPHLRSDDGILVEFYVSDNEAPQINFSSPTNSEGTTLFDKVIQVAVEVSDQSGYNLTAYLFDSSGVLYRSQSASTNTTFSFTVIDPGTYLYNATSVDDYGNSNSTETRTVIISEKVEEVTSPAAQCLLEGDACGSSGLCCSGLSCLEGVCSKEQESEEDDFMSQFLTGFDGFFPSFPEFPMLGLDSSEARVVMNVLVAVVIIILLFFVAIVSFLIFQR